MGHMSNLRHHLEVQFADFEDEYELIGINLLYNSAKAVRFMQHEDLINSKLMFHGCTEKSMGSIFQQGFRTSRGRSIGKLYGQGHYVPPQVIHAIRYLHQLKDRKTKGSPTITLIAAWVNPGKAKTLNGF